MAKKIRLIARLDVKDEHLVKGIQYEGLRKLGAPHDFAVRYYEAGIDELLYLDTVASLYGRNNLSPSRRAAACAACRTCARCCAPGPTRWP